MSTDLDRPAPPVTDGLSANLSAMLDAQRSDFLRAGSPSVELRRDRIDRLILLLTEGADEFSATLHADFGNRPHAINLVSEVAGILPDLLATRRHLKSWMRPQRIASAALLGMPTVVEKKPLGVVGVIGPWNFPVSLVVQPAAAAFAAGNRVMIKFSEVTPRTAELFAAKAATYFDPTELTVVTGGPEVGAAFSALRFDHLFFTGSPQVGALVASTAARIWSRSPSNSAVRTPPSSPPTPTCRRWRGGSWRPGWATAARFACAPITFSFRATGWPSSSPPPPNTGGPPPWPTAVRAW